MWQASITPGHALTVAFDRKRTAAAEDCQRQGIAFIPLAAESPGGWHVVAVSQLKKLSAALARNTGQKEQEAEQQLWQRLGIFLQEGNAALISNRIPASGEPKIVF